jgi:hypothetical protein
MTQNGNNTEAAPEKSLQEQVEEKKAPTRKLFGTFGGVFTPTLLTSWVLSCTCGKGGSWATPVSWARGSSLSFPLP